MLFIGFHFFCLTRQDSCFSVILLPFALALQACILLPDLRACDLLPENAQAYYSLMPEDLAAILLRPGVLAAALASTLAALLLLRSSVARFRLEQECIHLRRHLEDINQDKHYQVLLQKNVFFNVAKS